MMIVMTVMIPMALTLEGMLIDTNDEQPWNADVPRIMIMMMTTMMMMMMMIPIEVTLVGIDTDVSDKQFKKALDAKKVDDDDNDNNNSSDDGNGSSSDDDAT